MRSTIAPRRCTKDSYTISSHVTGMVSGYGSSDDDDDDGDGDGASRHNSSRDLTKRLAYITARGQWRMRYAIWDDTVTYHHRWYCTITLPWAVTVLHWTVKVWGSS